MVGNHHFHPLNLGFQVSQMFYVKSSKLDHRFLLSLKWCGYRNCGICPHGNTCNICSFIAGEPGNFGKPESFRIESCLKSYSFHVLGTWSHGSKGRYLFGKNITIGPFDLRVFLGSMGKFYLTYRPRSKALLRAYSLVSLNKAGY